MMPTDYVETPDFEVHFVRNAGSGEILSVCTLAADLQRAIDEINDDNPNQYDLKRESRWWSDLSKEDQRMIQSLS